jgi:RHS repeat-associated protein
MPFADAMGQDIQPYKYNNKELDGRNGLNWYDYSAKYLSLDIPVMPTVDPMAEKYYSWSPYAYVMNNPLRYIDPDGCSTHTDSLGHVVAVYNDGNKGVFKHNSLPSNFATYEGQTEKYIDADGNEQTREIARLSGGENMGETYYWDEFRGHNNKTGEVSSRVDGKIMFGESWNNDIVKLNKNATTTDLSIVARRSGTNGYYDIKTKPEYAPYGGGTGKTLNGKYISARSAGNFLAGMNGATGKFQGSYISLEVYMRLAGALHSAQNRTNPFIAPYYGEIPYAGRMIISGFRTGLNMRK